MLVRPLTPRKCNLDAEIDERADLGGLMLAPWVEGEERKTLAVPVGKQVDEIPPRHMVCDAPADYLGDAGPRDAF